MKSTATVGLMALATCVGLGIGCSDDPPPLPIAQGGSGGAGGEGGDGGEGPTFEGLISTSTATRFESDPQLSSNGDVIAIVWSGRREPNQPASIGYVMSLDGGATFSDVATISDADLSYQSPDVEVDNNGTAYLTFLAHERGQGGAEIMFATSSGEQFGEPEAVTDTETTSFYAAPAIGLTNTSRVLIVFSETVGNGSELRIAQRDQASSEWMIDVDSGGGQNFNAPSLCTAANTPMGRTYMVANVQGRAILRRTDDNGMTWEGIQASADGDQIGGPSSCFAIGTNVWVSYGVRGNSGLSEVKVAHSEDGGETILNVGVVSDPELKPTFAIHAITAAPPELGHLVYYNGVALGDDASSIYRVRFTPDNLLQEPPMLPDDPEPGLSGVLVHEPVSLQLIDSDQRWLGNRMGVDYEDGKLFVAYVDNSGEESHVAFIAIDI